MTLAQVIEGVLGKHGCEEAAVSFNFEDGMSEVVFSCEVCGVEPSPTMDCHKCGEEYGQCDNCILDYEVKCPHCNQWQS